MKQKINDKTNKSPSISRISVRVTRTEKAIKNQTVSKQQMNFGEVIFWCWKRSIKSIHSKQLLKVYSLKTVNLTLILL
jgi:hypothetical protein